VSVHFKRLAQNQESYKLQPVQNQVTPGNTRSWTLLAAMGEYPLPTIAELSPKPPSTRVLTIDDALMNSMPVDPFDVARTRKRSVLGADAAQRLLSPSIADVTQEVHVSELEVIEPAFVAVAPILTPVPFATPYEQEPQSSEQVFATEVAQPAVRTASSGSRARHLRLGAFAVASLLAMGGGSAMGVVSTPALLRAPVVRIASSDVRSLKKVNHVLARPMQVQGVSVSSLPSAAPATKKSR
jgi:hypothetical protein